MSAWIVINAIVNKPNTCIAIHSSDDDRTKSRVTLWKTDPLELLPWTVELQTNLNPYVSLAFIEDGKYLAVCYGHCVEVLDAWTSNVFKTCVLPEQVQPMSVAIKSDGKRIAVSRNDKSLLRLIRGRISEPTIETLSSSNISSSGFPVDLVTTMEGTSEVSLIYSVGGCHLFVVYRPNRTDQTILGTWFDFHTKTRLREISFAEGQYQDGPLRSLQTGVILVSSNPRTSPRTTLSLCKRKGEHEFKIGADDLICGTGSGGILLTLGSYINYFDPTYWNSDLDPEFQELGIWHAVSGEYIPARGATAATISLWTWDGEDECPRQACKRAERARRSARVAQCKPRPSTNFSFSAEPSRVRENL